MGSNCPKKSILTTIQATKANLNDSEISYQTADLLMQLSCQETEEESAKTQSVNHALQLNTASYSSHSSATATASGKQSKFRQFQQERDLNIRTKNK